jgi:hypothetical protein
LEAAVPLAGIEFIGTGPVRRTPVPRAGTGTSSWH